MEPLQMKKRKKGGGYNLRKSLAWDRAFFTEEGVLDPLELSMISGSFGNSCGEPLSIISEDSDCSTDSANLQSLEGTSHKEFPSPSSVGDKRKGSCFHTKTNSSVHDNAAPTSEPTRKVHSPPCIRTETKNGGCPTPLASSSLKRPANVNTARTVGKKDSKLPKVPISKPSPTRTKSAILSESHLKHNQITQPAVNVHKNVGLKSSSKNFKAVQSKAKTRPNCLPSPIKKSSQHSGRSSANTRLEVQPSNTPLQLTRNPTSNSSESQDESTLAVSLPQNTKPNAMKSQNRYIQTVKPSGLRMPSPSLGFFGQPKALGSNSVLQKNTQPSNIPKHVTYGLQKFSELRPTSTQSALNSGSRKIMKLDMEVKNAQKVERKIPAECKSDQPIRSEHEVVDIIDTNLITQEPTKHNKVEKVAYIVEAKSHMNDSERLLQSGSCKQLRKDEFKNSSGENNTCVSNYDLGDLGNYDLQVSCLMNHDQLSTDQAELSVESQKIESRDKRNVNYKIVECSGSKLGSHKVQENGADPKLWAAPHEIISVERSERNLSSSGGDKQGLKVGELSEQSEEHLELKSFCLAVEQNSHCNLELHLDDDVSSFCEESLVEEVIKSVESGLLERNDVNRSESSNFDMDKMAEKPSIVNPENFKDADFDDNEKLIGEITSSDLNASLSNEPVLSVGNVQKTEVSVPKNDVGVEEAEANSSIYNSHQMSKSKESFNSPPYQFQHEEQVTGVIDSVSNSSESGTQKDKLVTIKPPSDAVPFSDEWLAAIEAAGEDILTMKGGAVQNSPPDRSQPEPSPWSPVKKKNNQIGPFDCTKCTNTLPTD